MELILMENKLITTKFKFQEFHKKQIFGRKYETRYG